jgi:hypothetical protein
MPQCQAPQISDIWLKATHANDNYTPINLGMKSFEPGSVRVQRDYTKRNQIGLIVSLSLWAAVFAVAFVVPLLN